MNFENQKPSCGCSKPAPKPCCGAAPKTQAKQAEIKGDYITGWIETKMGKTPQVSTKLNKSDLWGNLKARLDISRMDYKVNPGLYAIGTPGADSVVLVTANYKLTFDTLRKELGGLNAWILVLDTNGVNVWCAAGKKTFSTDELVNRIDGCGLKDIVNHRRVIVPQLGATGVSAHEVRKMSGFSVVYGPVRASDIPTFLETGMKTTPDMRQVRFSFYDRLIGLPVEVVQGGKILLFICVAVFLLSGLNRSGYSIHATTALFSVLNVLLAYIAGTIIGPLLLPWLPGRSFSVKGAEAGALVFIVSYLTGMAGANTLLVIAWFLAMTAFSSFITLNFTGASTFTSLSGVKKEMRIAIPAQITTAAIGAILFISAIFIKM